VSSGLCVTCKSTQRKAVRAASAAGRRRRRQNVCFRLGLAVALGTGVCLGADWTVTPEAGLEATGFPLGPFLPSSSTYVLSNAANGVLEWAAGRSAPWVGLSEARGSLAPGSVASVNVLVSSQALTLPAGGYVARVSFTNLSGGGAVITREVRLQIVLPPTPSVAWVMIASNAWVIRVTGQPGALFHLDTSTNLLEWLRIYTNTLSGGAAIFDFMLTAEPQRFYRAFCPDANVPPHLSITNDVTYQQSQTQVKVTGEPGGLYQLEVSADQSHWTPVATNKFCGTDNFVYTIPGSQGTGSTYQVRALDTPPLEPAHHVLIVGQSLAVGVEGVPALSTVASDRHLRFYSDPTGSYLNALYELGLETIASGSAQQASLEGSSHRLVLSNVGLGSADYTLLKKGTDNYALGLQQFREAAAPLACRLLGYRPSALFAVHGESDAFNPRYDLDIRQWQADYEADVRNLTGCEVNLPMFHTQIAAWTSRGGPSTALSPYKVLAESEANPTKTILVGPRYFLPHALPGGIHLINSSYRWLGEYYGKVFRRVVIEGGPWTPLKPTSITRTGAVITAKFHVPVPPLALDTSAVSDPGNFGFEYHDDSPSPPAIAAVEITDLDTVQITLSAIPTGANPRLRYAYTGVSGSPGGPFTGPRGNLHDSDSETSLFEEPLYNWCVHFDKPIP